ncbi:dipeptidase PepE [uncultured Paraglaciecola sp.]|uniref:dipeptidase PepE n=1 Tax=uncultured Paraglaciecola sp. TaxID=1765024 RepID=UPI002599104F|nr:dipeptidase PepE [uncultured Paraglaciecola sp.]
MKVLMLSSSRKGSEEYLAHALSMITSHIRNIKDVLFIPYAGVTLSWDDYTQKVQDALPHLRISGIHEYPNTKEAINNAKAILVGGGNTFNLLSQLYKQDILADIQQSVKQGTPYIGWSAGSNICGNSIRTTNDMPIIQPPSFDALNFVPFQLNPHYTDYQPPGHNGETRAQRIEEFCTLNPKMPVIGIREGSALLLKDKQLTLEGELEGVVFEVNQISEGGVTTINQKVLKPSQDISQYLQIKR